MHTNVHSKVMSTLTLSLKERNSCVCMCLAEVVVKRKHVHITQNETISNACPQICIRLSCLLPLFSFIRVVIGTMWRAL